MRSSAMEKTGEFLYDIVSMMKVTVINVAVRHRAEGLVLT